MSKATARAKSNGEQKTDAKTTDSSRRVASSSRRTKKAPQAAMSAAGPKTWTFLTNHSHVLILLYSEPGLVLREVANRVGITERAEQRIVQDLEEGGFVRREKVGRKNQYEVLTDKALRHPIEWHRDIGDLIRLITG